MKFLTTNINDVYIIELDIRTDERGFFARTFCAKEFKEHGLRENMVQSNLSYSAHKHTLRGMHYQIDGAEEAKLVRCVNGSVLDTIIDIRKDSSTYGKYISVELTDDNNKMLYVPEGFAHGFLTLQDNSTLFYQVSNFYTPGKERGIRYNDPSFNINWPVDKPYVISEKDNNWPDYKL